MKKLYVDEILKTNEKQLANPGPGQYTHTADTVAEASKRGSVYSMRKRLYEEDRRLKKQSKLPGPGSYQSPDLTGTVNKTSNVTTAQSNAFSKSQDRFKIANTDLPAPNLY